MGVEALAAVYTIRFLLPGPKTGGEGAISGEGGVGITDDGSDVLGDTVDGTSLASRDKEGTLCVGIGGGGDTTWEGVVGVGGED